MKTHEEIRKGLECCLSELGEQCSYCPYYFTSPCQSIIAEDALAYIRQLEDTIGQMILQMRGDCGVCKHRHEQRKTPFDIVKGEFSIPIACDRCMLKDNHPNWEYEGVPEVTERC